VCQFALDFSEHVYGVKLRTVQERLLLTPLFWFEHPLCCCCCVCVLLASLQQSYPHLLCFQPGAAAAAAGLQGSLSLAGEARLASYVDLLQLSRAAVPSLVKLPHISLSKLVNALLGKPLDKTEQTSAWDVRPLRNQQLDYAAKDAYVLTVLFDAVLGRLPEGLHAGLLAAVGQSSQISWPVTQLDEEAEAQERGAVRSAA
jgi:hypothetical protein